MSSLVSKGMSAVGVCQDDLLDETVQKIMQGEFQVVYFTPESLVLNRRWRRMLLSEVYQERLRALAIDEAHTVQKW